MLTFSVVRAGRDCAVGVNDLPNTTAIAGAFETVVDALLITTVVFTPTGARPTEFGSGVLVTRGAALVDALTDGAGEGVGVAVTVGVGVGLALSVGVADALGVGVGVGVALRSLRVGCGVGATYPFARTTCREDPMPAELNPYTCNL